MSNGAYGSLAVGLFASPSRLKLVFGHATHAGLFYSGSGLLLGIQCIGILFVLGWIAVLMFPFFCILNYYGLFRSDILVEISGLDASYHGARHLGVDGVDMELVQQLRSEPKNTRNRFSRSSAGPGADRLPTANVHQYNVETARSAEATAQRLPTANMHHYTVETVQDASEYSS
jgi:hypothetical protein